MRQKQTEGYRERIRLALDQGPRPMSVRALAKEMAERYPELRGTSYGGIRLYSEGKVRNPRLDLLRAMSDVLGVRSDWLAFGEGEMTEEEQALARVRSRRSVPPDDGGSGALVSELSEEELAAYGEPAASFFRFHQIVSDTLGRMEAPSAARGVMEGFLSELAAKRPTEAPEPDAEAVTAYLEECFGPALRVSRGLATHGEIMGAFHATASALYLAHFGSAKEEDNGEA